MKHFGQKRRVLGGFFVECTVSVMQYFGWKWEKTQKKSERALFFFSHRCPSFFLSSSPLFHHPLVSIFFSFLFLLPKKQRWEKRERGVAVVVRKARSLRAHFSTSTLLSPLLQSAKNLRKEKIRRSNIHQWKRKKRRRIIKSIYIYIYISLRVTLSENRIEEMYCNFFSVCFFFWKGEGERSFGVSKKKRENRRKKSAAIFFFCTYTS